MEIFGLQKPTWSSIKVTWNAQVCARNKRGLWRLLCRPAHGKTGLCRSPELCCCWEGRGREFELSRGSLDSSMWKIRTICWQRGQIGGRRKIIPPLPPPRRAANGLQHPGLSSPSLSRGITSWLVSKNQKKREFSIQTNNGSSDALPVSRTTCPPHTGAISVLSR